MEAFQTWVQCNFLNHAKREENEKNALILKNGRALFEEHISSCKGRCRCNPIRSFSAKQILEATNFFQYDKEVKEATNYFRSDSNGEFLFKWFKGALDDCPVLIKKYEFTYNNEAYRDIVVSSQMSSHKNVLKLLGCCLEFPDPILVYEFAENGPLNKTGCVAFNSLSLSWKTRLSVAKDIANTITYLHIAFPRPIIHRDIKPLNIFLDKNSIPKLCNFTLSITIPEGETSVKDIVHGTFGFLDPVYITTSTVTEHTDVYSFGVLLLVLLTGKSAISDNRTEIEAHICSYVTNLVENGRFDEVIDPKILAEQRGNNNMEQIQQEMKDLIELALRCVEEKREDRPLMIQVARELAKIERSTRCPLGN